MIYILSGNDTKNKNAYLKKLYKKNQSVFLMQTNNIKEDFLNHASSLSLFGGPSIVIAENILKDGNIIFSQEEFSILKDSKTTFIFIEDKLSISEIKKYEKNAKIEDFSTQIIKQTPKINIFNIANSFSQKNKINTWILYREAISLGISPEEISGILFWKIKTMLLNGEKLFSNNELKILSSSLVYLYHRAHQGECDFVIGLEQFILSSLSKK